MKFDHPVTVGIDGKQIVVDDAAHARDVLIERWPGKRGPRHRDALETSLKVIDGHRSTVEAEIRFREAAREAGILAEPAPALPHSQ
ncbi:DUF982 domain-containing protein [Mesorhizobium sp. IMUNJ 23232]|uniref:DUF982 domain-containing protein n=1 Tax=Mesorhizobium sp. IMUNJ 23232 TaxID=3376064 RepID=UPI0037917571